MRKLLVMALVTPLLAASPAEAKLSRVGSCREVWQPHLSVNGFEFFWLRGYRCHLGTSCITNTPAVFRCQRSDRAWRSYG